jgi:SNF2 family DNA or RNA helicase
MLWLLGKHLGRDFELFTGDQTPRERDDAVQRFTNDKNCRVLLSSDAGGIGLDLPVANYLISYDLPWSAGKFEQRNGRILRISSEWPEVTLISMMMRDSVEERMYDMLMEKSAVASAWLDGKGIDAQGTFALTLGSLADFLEEHQIRRSVA